MIVTDAGKQRNDLSGLFVQSYPLMIVFGPDYTGRHDPDAMELRVQGEIPGEVAPACKFRILSREKLSVVVPTTCRSRKTRESPSWRRLASSLT